MQQIPDDPIIACMERTGYPPWMQDDEEDRVQEEPFAVYDPE
jgi:hypothetical protein